jgi:hypothetical protein
LETLHQQSLGRDRADLYATRPSVAFHRQIKSHHYRIRASGGEREVASQIYTGVRQALAGEVADSTTHLRGGDLQLHRRLRSTAGLDLRSSSGNGGGGELGSRQIEVGCPC